MRHRLSLRLRFSVFWEAGRDMLGAPESASYVLIRTPVRKLFGAQLYVISEENRGQQFDEIVVHNG